MSSQINGSGPLIRELVSEINKFTEQIRLYEDFMYMMQDRYLKGEVDTVIKIYRVGNAK